MIARPLWGANSMAVSPVVARRKAEDFVSDIFTEVDEEVRREQLKKLWEKYGNYVAAVAFLIVAGVAGWRGYEWYQGKLAATAGAAYDAANQFADQGKHEEAAAGFAKLAADGTAGYRQLARMREAAQLARTDRKAAVNAYDEIAADKSAGQVIRDLAAVRAGFLLIDSSSSSRTCAAHGSSL